MPVTYLIDGIITVDELRERIGDPTTDNAEVGRMVDAMFEAIIQSHHDGLVAWADAKMKEQVMQGLPPGPKELFKNDELLATVVTPNFATVNEATFDPSYYPFPMLVVTSDGLTLDQDENISRTANTSYVVRYRYKTQGDYIYWIPTDEASIIVHLATYEDLRNHWCAEKINSLNDHIVEDAYKMLRRLIREGYRLEGIILPDDGQLGDKGD